MTVDWAPLNAELRQWRAAALPLPIWWRDDDAIDHTAALDRLLDLAAQVQVPVHLAVIPAQATDALASVIESADHTVPLVHGWRHTNHAPTGQKKSEFGQMRPHAITDCTRGLAHLQSLFGARLMPMFVPPWNRIAADLIADLPDAGYAALSGFTPRQSRLAAPGLIQINTHVDPINWRGGGGLVPVQTQIGALVALLTDRRKGRIDRQEPLGLLTHHLVHDEDIWTFSHQLLSVLLEGGAIPLNLQSLEGPLP